MPTPTPSHRPPPEPAPTAATGLLRVHALDVDHDTLARSPWRVGRSLGGRTVYAVVGEGPSKRDVLIGGMDTEALGELVVAEHNAHLDGSTR